MLCVVLVALSARAVAQVGPYNQNAQVNMGAPLSGDTQSIITVPVNVDLSGVTAVDSGGNTVSAALGGVRIAINYDNTQLSAILDNGRVGGGSSAGFTADPVANVISGGSLDALVFTASQLATATPTGLVNVANVKFSLKGTPGTVVPLQVTVMDLRSPLVLLPAGQGPFGGVRIPNQASAGSITITGSADTDGDGLPDAWESANGLDFSDPGDALLDSDSDGLINLDEYANLTDPQNPDSDGDGVPDGGEVLAGRDPNDPADFPLWIVSVPVTSALTLAPYQYAVSANMSGAQYFLDQSPAGMAIDIVTGVIDWTPEVNQAGDFSITVRTTTATEQATQSFSISVTQSLTVNGDINGDGVVNAGDLVLLTRHVLGLTTLTVEQVVRGDLYPAGTGDGVLTVSDMVLLQKIILGQ